MIKFFKHLFCHHDWQVVQATSICTMHPYWYKCKKCGKVYIP